MNLVRTYHDNGSSFTSPDPNVSAIHSAASDTSVGVNRTYFRGAKEEFEVVENAFGTQRFVLTNFSDINIRKGVTRRNDMFILKLIFKS